MTNTLLIAAIVIASVAGWFSVIRHAAKRRALPRAEMSSHDGLPPTANEIKGFQRQALESHDTTSSAGAPDAPGGGD